jgi:hypothetical protein
VTQTIAQLEAAAPRPGRKPAKTKAPHGAAVRLACIVAGVRTRQPNRTREERLRVIEGDIEALKLALRERIETLMELKARG